MATRGGSAPWGAQVVDPAGAGDRWLPVGVGGRTGWSRDVREAAAEKGGSSAPARHPRPSRGSHLQGGLDAAVGSVVGKGAALRGGATSPLPGGGQRGWGAAGATHRSEASSLLMYSSRMLVSMLEGSRAPLMSWPVGEGWT